MKLRYSILACVVIGGGVLAAASVDTLTLPERALPGLDPILHDAVQQSPQMLNHALDLEIAENSRIEARAGLLPTLGGSYRMTETQDDRADQTEVLRVKKVYYDLSLYQPLFFWGERRNNARIGVIAKQMAEGNYREAYRQLAQQLRSGFGNLIIQKVALARAQRYMTYAQQQVSIAEARLAKKEISDLDAFPVRLAAERGQIALEQSAFDFENAKQSFARLAGIPAIADSQIPDEIPLVPYSPEVFEQLLATFLGAKESPNVNVINQRRQVEINQLTFRNQQTRLRPKISAVMGASQDEQAYSINASQKYRVDSRYIGVQVTWNIFDGFASYAATRSSLARRRQAENELAEVSERMQRQAQTQARYINFAARSVAISDRGLDSGRGALRAKEGEFKRGIASESDVSLAELALFDVRISAYSARLDLMLKIGEFLGTLNQDPVVALLPKK
ncbi:MAG: TolC family protein [Candidatus Didemnitutus sp.]|nr:TolC family protein [Candidatus Didemnitutus sp.]